MGVCVGRGGGRGYEDDLRLWGIRATEIGAQHSYFTSDVLHSRNQAPPRKNGRYSEPSAHSRPAHYVSRDVPEPEWSRNETKERLGQTLLIIGSPCAISLCVKEPSLAGDGGGAALLHAD